MMNSPRLGRRNHNRSRLVMSSICTAHVLRNGPHPACEYCMRRQVAYRASCRYMHSTVVKHHIIIPSGGRAPSPGNVPGDGTLTDARRSGDDQKVAGVMMQNKIVSSWGTMMVSSLLIRHIQAHPKLIMRAPLAP